jgi:hypothetical protein
MAVVVKWQPNNKKMPQRLLNTKKAVSLLPEFDKV